MWTQTSLLLSSTVALVLSCSRRSPRRSSPPRPRFPTRSGCSFPIRTTRRRTTSGSSRCTSGSASRTSPTAWTSSGCRTSALVDPEVHALWKDTEKFTHRTVGIAVTARYVPTNRREPQMDQKTIGRWYSTVTSEAFMKVLYPGAMLVIDAMDDGESRSIGSSNILAWKKLGMIGLVTGGGLADTDEIIYHKVPVWFRRLARGIRPGRNELESVNRPVTVGGVLVRPGDVVVADGDGVVVVPRERAEEVAKAALTFLDNITRERYIKETGQNPWAKKPGN